MSTFANAFIEASKEAMARTFDAQIIVLSKAIAKKLGKMENANKIENAIRECTGAKARKPRGQGAAKKGDSNLPPSPPEEVGEIKIILNYTEKTHGIFGKTNKIASILKKAGCAYRPMLKYGKGWTSTKDGESLDKLKEALDEGGYEYSETEHSDIDEKKFKKEMAALEEQSEDKKGEQSEAESDDEEEQSDSDDEEEEKPKTPSKGSKAPAKASKAAPAKSKSKTPEKASKAVPASKAKTPTKTPDKGAKTPDNKAKADPKEKKITLNLTTNDWSNEEEGDSGFIFLHLPVGPNGSKVGVAIGKQDVEKPVEAKGITSVLPLSAEDTKLCEKNKWRWLSDATWSSLKKVDPKRSAMLEKIKKATGKADSKEKEEAEEDAFEDAEQEVEGEDVD